jgi:hypothetical protein
VCERSDSSAHVGGARAFGHYDDSVLLLTRTGRVLTRGRNADGQLGHCMRGVSE